MQLLLKQKKNAQAAMIVLSTCGGLVRRIKIMSRQNKAAAEIMPVQLSLHISACVHNVFALTLTHLV